MGFFNNSISESYGPSMIDRVTDVSDLLEDSSVADLPEAASFYQCALEGAAMDEANWNGIMKACGLQEYSYYLETGEEFVYNEAAGSGFIESIRNFLSKVWEKIKSLFKKFMIFLNSHTKDGKEFVNKYRSDINKAVANIPSDATFKGYVFTFDRIDNIDENYSNATSAIMKDAESKTADLNNNRDFSGITKDSIKTRYNDDSKETKHTLSDDWDYEEEMESFRGSLIGSKGSSYSASEFSKELFELLRNGSSEKENIDLTASLLTKAMAELESSKEVEKTVKKTFDDANKWFTALDRRLTKIQKELSQEKPTGDSKALIGIQRDLSLIKGASSTMQTVKGIVLTALKDQVNQNKAICVKVVSFKSKTESYSFDNYDGSNFMEAAIARMQ